MERQSYEIVFSITLLKSTVSNREHKLILIFQGIARKKNPITVFMLQEIFVLQKINGHRYLDGAYSYCLLGSNNKHKC